MITELERSQIRGLIYSPQWRAIEMVAEMVINRFRSENTIKESEWETLKETILKEGRASGVEQFFQELIKQAEDATIKKNK